jgi:D-threo-aldose 1-dehydrogenase
MIAMQEQVAHLGANPMMTFDPAGRIALARTGIAISRLGIGGGAAFFDNSPAAAAQILDASWNAGVRYFDTSPLYGDGLSERLFGETLPLRPREGYVLSTKVGHYVRDGKPPHDPACYDYSAAGVRRSLEQSLKRLRVDRLDIVFIHDLVEEFIGADFERRYDEAMSGAYPALADLRRAGVIRGIGAAVKDWRVCLRLARDAAFDCFLLAADYTFLRTESLGEFLPYCAEHGIPVIAAAPFAMGLLATGAVPGALYFFKPPPAEILEKTQIIEAVAARHGVPLAQAALQFPLFHPAIVSVLVGVRSRAELERDALYLRTPTPRAFWAELKERKLIPAEAPTP